MRKADREGHSSDVLADSLSRAVLGVRFRRREESQFMSAKKLFNTVLEGIGKEALSLMQVTADRGFGKEMFTNIVREWGMSFIFIMPEHLPHVHPFVASSYISEENNSVESSLLSGIQHGSSTTPSNVQDSGNDEVSTSDSSSMRIFVIPDSAILGQEVFCADKYLPGTIQAKRKSVAVAVREHGNEKKSKVVCFMYSVSPSLSSILDAWVAVPNDYIKFDRHLFNGLGDKLAKECELFLKQSCFPLTIGQRCADWFIMRRIRITGTNAGLILQNDEDFLSHLGIASNARKEKTLTEWMEVLCSSWFDRKVSTEPMKRDTANEAPVLSFIQNLSFVETIFEVGMLAKNSVPYLACYPDAVALINSELRSHLSVDRAEDISKNGEKYICATVEIKTKVSGDALDEAMDHIRVDPVFCNARDPLCH